MTPEADEDGPRWRENGTEPPINKLTGRRYTMSRQSGRTVQLDEAAHNRVESVAAHLGLTEKAAVSLLVKAATNKRVTELVSELAGTLASETETATPEKSETNRKPPGAGATRRAARRPATPKGEVGEPK